MIKISDSIALRDCGRDEDQLWKLIFFDSVRSHFDILNLPEEDLNRLLSGQYAAQTADYRSNYPKASNQIIVFDGADAGRVIWSTENGDLHLIDIVVLTEYRGKGIGGAVLNWFFEKSRNGQMPVRFCVEKGNRAMRLYERLGFRTVEDLNSHFQMEWRPEKSP